MKCLNNRKTLSQLWTKITKYSLYFVHSMIFLCTETHLPKLSIKAIKKGNQIFVVVVINHLALQVNDLLHRPSSVNLQRCKFLLWSLKNPYPGIFILLWDTAYTAHFMVHTAHCILHTEQCILHTTHCSLQTSHCTLHTAHCILTITADFLKIYEIYEILRRGMH